MYNEDAVQEIEALVRNLKNDLSSETDRVTLARRLSAIAQELLGISTGLFCDEIESWPDVNWPWEKA